MNSGAEKSSGVRCAPYETHEMIEIYGVGPLHFSSSPEELQLP